MLQRYYLFVSNYIHEFNLQEHSLLHKTTHIYNDNMVCVQWSKNRTTRSIRHTQLNENAFRESLRNGTKSNLSDIFTTSKEALDTHHHLSLPEGVVSPTYNTPQQRSHSS